MKYLIGWSAFLLSLWSLIAAIFAFIHTEWATGGWRLLAWAILMVVAQRLVGRTSAGRAVFGRYPKEWEK